MIGHDPPPPNPKGGERVPHAGYRIRVGGAHNDASEQAVSPCDGGVQMGRTVILDEQVNTARDIAGTSRNASNKRRLTQKSMRDMEGRSAILWMAVAMLAMTWASETRASPDQARHLANTQHATAARNLDSVGTAGDGDFEALSPSRGRNDKSVQVAQATTSDTGQSPEQEHHWAETLPCELTNARRDIDLLQHLERERGRADWMEQGIAAARSEVEAQPALAVQPRV